MRVLLRLLLVALLMPPCAAPPAPPAPLASLAPELPRAQRSANLSHITGTSRQIQMFLRSRYLQLLPDGTVNGTTDGTSEYTILQRATYKVGLLTIQGVSTCLYLCMDVCGFQYAHKDLSDDCMFNEHIEKNNYNTYSRTRAGKTTFVALANNGEGRRLQLPEGRALGNLSRYASTLTRPRDAPAPACAARRHRGKLKRIPKFHRTCAKRVTRQRHRRRNTKKAHEPPKKKHRQPKARRKLENTTPTSTTTEWEESTASTTTEGEVFRGGAAREAVGRS